MRIVSRKTFLSLPEGTVYAKVRKWIVDHICVKGESLGNDWYYQSFNWVDANDSGEAIDRLEEMMSKGVSYPVENAISRDGLFDEDQMFLVYEKDDIKLITDSLNNSTNLKKARTTAILE